MNIKYPFKITGLGECLPETCITSAELESKLNIPQGWSARYSGVRERYHAAGKETNAFLGARSLERAIEDAQLHLSDIDMLISASVSVDFLLPNQASTIKSELSNSTEFDFPCVDINSSCLSFVTALDYAAKSLDWEAGIRNVAIVTSEISSKGLDPTNWETATLFGDAAVTIIISCDQNNDSGLIKYDLRTFASDVELAIVKGGGNRYHSKDHPYDPALYFFEMQGKKLLKNAKLRIPEFMDSFFKNLPISIREVDWIIPHQASKAGLEIFKRMYGLNEEKVPSNLETRGNCIAASIPSLLVETIRSGKLGEGQTIFLSGTAAGFSIGGVLFKYR